jgi:hypothetical protein
MKRLVFTVCVLFTSVQLQSQKSLSAFFDIGVNQSYSWYDTTCNPQLFVKESKTGLYYAFGLKYQNNRTLIEAGISGFSIGMGTKEISVYTELLSLSVKAGYMIPVSKSEFFYPYIGFNYIPNFFQRSIYNTTLDYNGDEIAVKVRVLNPWGQTTKGFNLTGGFGFDKNFGELNTLSIRFGFQYGFRDILKAEFNTLGNANLYESIQLFNQGDMIFVTIGYAFRFIRP